MATIKKTVKKAVKKAMAKRPMMQAPPSASSPMGGGSMMKAGGKIKKYQKSGPALKKEMNAKEYLLSGKPQGTNAPSPKKEMNAKDYLESGKPTKYVPPVAPPGYTKRSLGSGAVDFRPTDKAKEYLDSLGNAYKKAKGIKKNGGKMKTGGTLSPSKKAVSKNVGNLNKAKAGAKMKMGGKCKNGC